MNAGRRNRSGSRRKTRMHRRQLSQESSSNVLPHAANSHEASAPSSSRSRGQNDAIRNLYIEKRHRGRQATPVCSSTAGQASNSQGPDNSPTSDIPGYYFDEETKLYFKIQSYNLGIVAPFVTKDKIVSQQKESQRIKDVNKLACQNRATSTTSFKSDLTTLRERSHLLAVLNKMQCGRSTCWSTRSYMIRHMCSRIQPDLEYDNFLPAQPSMLLSEIRNMEVCKDRDKIVCVSSVTSDYSHAIQLVTVQDLKQPGTSNPNRTNVKINIPLQPVGSIYNRVKTICWAPLADSAGQSTVFYTTVCPIGFLDSIAYLSNLDAQTVGERIIFQLNLGKNIIWSSAWNKHGQKFTIGSERKCCLIDVASRKQWTFSTGNSDPLSQLFSNSGLIIYNGTRKGEILLQDVRAPVKGHNSMVVKQAPGVGCLRLMEDENYFLASDFTGAICTWDQRMRKKVMEYKGLMNSHWQLPFNLDESESLLTSTGSDSYTHIWDVKTGDILRKIPPFYPVSCDGFPLSFYSTHWGGREGNSALLVAMRNRFRFYTYKETG